MPRPVGALVHDLHFEPVMDGKPGVLGPIGDPDVDAGVVAFAGGLVDDADDAIAELFARIPEQAHAALGAEEAVLDHELARPDVLPAVEGAAVEEGPPVR